MPPQARRRLELGCTAGQTLAAPVPVAGQLAFTVRDPSLFSSDDVSEYMATFTVVLRETDGASGMGNGAVAYAELLAVDSSTGKFTLKVLDRMGGAPLAGKQVEVGYSLFQAR